MSRLVAAQAPSAALDPVLDGLPCLASPEGPLGAHQGPGLPCWSCLLDIAWSLELYAAALGQRPPWHELLTKLGEMRRMHQRARVPQLVRGR